MLSVPLQHRISIYIGSADKFRCCEPVIERSIRENTAAELDITFMRPEALGIPLTGCTGFTNLRYAVPHLAHYRGFAIYLDVDMIVLGDIAELYKYREAGKWVRLEDGSDEVAVISCGTHPHMPCVEDIHKHHKSALKAMTKGKNSIPLSWNVKDEVKEGMNLLHFTDLKAQPWFYEHPCKEAVQVYARYGGR